MTRKTQLALATLLAALPLAVAAADRGGGPPRRPPQEAFTACASAQRGDACTVKLGDRDLAGTCEAVPDESALACRPRRPPHPHGPPPEAVEACKSASEGAACTVTHGDHTLNGTCEKGPDGNGPLACRPAGGPPPPA